MYPRERGSGYSPPDQHRPNQPLQDMQFATPSPYRQMYPQQQSQQYSGPRTGYSAPMGNHGDSQGGYQQRPPLVRHSGPSHSDMQENRPPRRKQSSNPQQPMSYGALSHHQQTGPPPPMQARTASIGDQPSAQHTYNQGQTIHQEQSNRPLNPGKQYWLELLGNSPEGPISPPYHANPRRFCNCERGPPDPKAQVIKCQECGHLQHADCIIDDDSQETRAFCNNCKLSWWRGNVHRQLNWRAGMEQMVMRKRHFTSIFYRQQLWKEYCKLQLKSASVSDIGRVFFWTEMINGEPRYPAPGGWVEEMQRCVYRMTTRAPQVALDRFLVPRNEFRPLDLAILREWQDLAIWMLVHGPYVPRQSGTKLLGVLGELLGFVPKGLYWTPPPPPPGAFRRRH